MEVNEEIFEEYFKVIKGIIDSELFYKEAKKQYIKWVNEDDNDLLELDITEPEECLYYFISVDSLKNELNKHYIKITESSMVLDLTNIKSAAEMVLSNKELKKELKRIRREKRFENGN